MSSRSVNVRDIFGNIQAKKDAMRDASGADILKSERKIWKPMWPHHKEDNIDRIVKKERYSDWQNRKYPVKVSFPEEARVRQVRTTGCTIVHAERMKDPISIRPVDENYDRKRIAAD